VSRCLAAMPSLYPGARFFAATAAQKRRNKISLELASDVGRTGLRFQKLEHELKPNLIAFGRLRTYISFTHSARSSERSTMDWHDSKLNGTVFGIHDWLNYLRDQAATYRKLVERADDPLVKTELLALVSVCEEIADNIEDHLTGESDRAPRGPLSKLS